MTIGPKTSLGALVLMGGLFPAVLTAQPCNPSETVLLSCTFREGERTLKLCLNGDTLSYAFGPTGGTPTLEMIRAFEDVRYTPFSGAGATIYESVTLYNGNTGYEMFTSSRIRVDQDAIAEGGIVVLLPSGESQTLTCDAGTVQPANPFEGIGALARLTGDGDDDPLGYCLARLSPADPATACLGRYREVEISNGVCDPAADASNCWAEEAAAWDMLVDTRFNAALAYLANLADPVFLDTLKVAQDTWSISRNLDCDVYLRNPFAPDGGTTECQAFYAAARVSFLQDVVSGAEFDG